MSITSFGAYLISGTTYPKLTQNGHCLDRKPGSGQPVYFLWNLGMRFYQYHPEGEIKPFQWVVSQNAQVGFGRLEPLGKTEEFCAMIRAQDNYPSRSDLQSLRSVSVQRRAEKLPEPGHPAEFVLKQNHGNSHAQTPPMPHTYMRSSSYDSTYCYLVHFELVQTCCLSKLCYAHSLL